MLFRKCQANGEVQRLEIGGTVVGLLAGASYSDAAVAMEEGDLLVLFTDGITETTNTVDEEWGEACLIHTINECKDSRSREMIADVMRAADRFCRRCPARRYDASGAAGRVAVVIQSKLNQIGGRAVGKARDAIGTAQWRPNAH